MKYRIPSGKEYIGCAAFLLTKLMSNETAERYLLEIRGISKCFGSVQALKNANLSIKPASVHALIGENGAGKSTLMKIINGMYSADSGEMVFKGQKVAFASPQKALAAGISMIHQELMPILELSVADNIFMGKYPRTALQMVDRRGMIHQTRKLLEELDIRGISPTAQMKTLSMAQTQMVEIAKAVSNHADLIIMDEPTSSLTDDDVERLFTIIRRLQANNGTSFIYISHRLEEIFTICDTITVLRDGETIETDDTANFTNDRLVHSMVGRELKNLYNKVSVPIGEPVLEVTSLCGKGFENVSFTLRRGEILGIAGLVGAGRTELVESIFGLRKITSGQICKDGKPLTITSTAAAIRNGISLATEDRKQLGLVLGLGVGYNISLPSIRHFAKGGLVRKRMEDQQTGVFAKLLGVKASSLKTKTGTLSGGNQQKVVLAKWLLTQPDVFILDEPTRGIDVGAKADIYAIMEEFVKQGKSIIMISSELSEVLGMSDRILVMHEGHVVGEMPREEATQEKIGRLFGIEKGA